MTNVRDFGAVGDGQVDDTEAIQHAIDRGGGLIQFPRGTYRLRRSLVVELARHGRLGFSGDGGTARLVMEGPGAAIRFTGTHDQTADPGDFRPGVWENERMPTVSGLEIVGAHEEAEGIALEGTMQATITGVSIRRCRVGVHLIRRNRNLLLADSHIYDGVGPAIGVFFDRVNLHQSIIVGCHISYCRHAGIKVIGSEVRNLQITGCDIEYNFDPDQPDSADVWIDAREGTVREVTIASNTIQAKRSPTGANVRIEGPDLPDSRGAGLWTIVGNILQSQAVNVLLRSCRGVTLTGNSFASGFERSLVLDHCRHVVVSGNTFDHNPDYAGDRVDGITVRGSAGITLTGLILEATRAGAPESGGAIEVFQSSEVAVVGCQVFNPAVRGLDLVDVRHCRVSNCTVLDRREPAGMREAIRLGGRSSRNLVNDNLVSTGTEGSLVIAPDSAAVSGNIIAEVRP